MQKNAEPKRSVAEVIAAIVMFAFGFMSYCFWFHVILLLVSCHIA